MFISNAYSHALVFLMCTLYCIDFRGLSGFDGLRNGLTDSYTARNYNGQGNRAILRREIASRRLEPNNWCG